MAPLFIEPGSHWENGYFGSCNARLRDELLDGEIFYTLKEVQVLTERWRWQYVHVRPHQALCLIGALHVMIPTAVMLQDGKVSVSVSPWILRRR